MLESKLAASPVENDAARLLREVSRRQKLLGVVRAPLFRAHLRRTPGLPNIARLLVFLPFLMAVALAAIARYLPEQAVLLGTILGVGFVLTLYLDVRCRQDALVALLEDSGTIGFPKTPAE